MKIKKIETIEVDNEDVYDITVPEHHNFLVEPGIFAHNCAQLIYSAFTNPIQTNIMDVANSINKAHSSITSQVRPMQYNLPKRQMSDREAMKKALAMFGR